MKRTALSTAFILLAGLLALACGGNGEEVAPVAAPAPAAQSTEVGAISGTIKYENGDPDSEIKMDADPVCQGLHSDAVHTEKVVADAEGNLANVLVYIKGGLSGSYPPPAESHTLDQRGCQYIPHVSAMMVGQKLVIRNSDPTLHNVHAMPKMNKEFNQGQPFQGMEFEKTFDKAEVAIPFKCDVHPWMASYMAVLDHPFFAVSGSNGAFGIDELPAGEYTVEAWHEELGAQSQKITVAANETVELTFSFAPKAAS